MQPLTLTCRLPGARRLRAAAAPAPGTVPIGRVPRLARLLALAHRFDGLVREGVVRDQADLARLGHVTRARITQIMNLLHLAPDIQEEILFLPPITQGRDRLKLRRLQPIVLTLEWKSQRRQWRNLRAEVN